MIAGRIRRGIAARRVALARAVPASLRWRLLLALVATSAVSLGVAATVVLSPLQADLRTQSAENLRAAVLASRPDFEQAMRQHDRARRGGDPGVSGVLGVFWAPANDLQAQTDGRVLVMDRTTLGEGTSRFVYDTEVASPDSRAVLLALRTLRTAVSQDAIQGDDVVFAIPLFDGADVSGALLVERRLTEVSTVVEQVRNAFLVAGLVGLAVAALLAFALSSTLLRRLGRLRAAALRITRAGPDAPAPYDEDRDEVGDLARALARMQEELRRQESARRAFVSTASHELRTPLTMLQGTMELLEEDLRDGRLDIEDAQEQVARARRELRRLSALAGELLDLSRLDAAVPLRSEAVELGELARAVAAEFALRATEQGVEIVAPVPPAPAWVRADPDAIARVVRILVDNALRYAPPGDTIAVVAARDGAEVYVSVSDHGPGVPPEERERIFERFYRGSRSGAESGFGLGLAIGRELARRMGGELTLLHTGQPCTRFALRLPVAPTPPPERTPAPAQTFS